MFATPMLTKSRLCLLSSAATCLMAVSSVHATDIRIVAGDQVIRASLEENEASKDFLTMLPLKVELSDYHNTEKIAYLSQSLSTDGMPNAMDPEVGDFTYFAPWGNIALFYEDFGYSRGLVKLGAINSDDLATLQNLPRMQITIERAAP